MCLSCVVRLVRLRPEEDGVSELYNAALSKWGETSQIHMAIEEMAELTNALMKFDRNRVSTTDVAEEIADVIIMCEQMSLIFGGTKYIEQIKQGKLFRLRNLLEPSHE